MEIDLHYRFFFLRKLVLIVVFLTITPLTLIVSVVSLISLSNSTQTIDSSPNKSQSSSIPGAQIYASLPETFPSVSGKIIFSDARIDIIKNFLSKYNSPLSEHSEFIVKTSDKYSLDYRLITAIAMKESGLCKIIPEESYNCWGWGIHSKGTLMFDSYDEGIETVSKGLKENYIDKGFTTVEEIMTKYAHPDSTTWADGVLQYMDQMK